MINLILELVPTNPENIEYNYSNGSLINEFWQGFIVGFFVCLMVIIIFFFIRLIIKNIKQNKENNNNNIND
ncbi:MAG: hypothetical protein ACI35W_01390 [Anaeroplasmataceae bacterium]